MKNGNLKLLLLELILADQVGRSTPVVLKPTGQEWSVHIATVKAHIGQSSGRCPLPCWY